MKDSPFRDLPQRMQASSELAPDSAMRGSGLRHVYRMTFDRFDPDEEALVWTFPILFASCWMRGTPKPLWISKSMPVWQQSCACR